MPASPDSVQQQVLMAMQALEKLSAREREERPYRHFGENYNKLLALAKESLPSAIPSRWPPVLTLTTAGVGPSHVDARYVEIQSYMNEIVSILSEDVEPLSFRIG